MNLAGTSSEPGAPAGLRIAYMTGQYPRATDTFIQREVAALRTRGVFVQSFSIRKPALKENVGPEQAAERERTHYVLPAKIGTIVRAHCRLILRWPGQYLSALKTALTVRPAGVKALVWQAAYFVEAGVVADQVVGLKLSHLHNHFSNSSCSVAMLAAEMGGFTFSFTMHGPAEFYEPKYWRIDEKVRRALFVACISNFCRSQAMVFAPQECWNKLHIVHCGVNPDDFVGRALTADPEMGGSDDPSVGPKIADVEEAGSARPAGDRPAAARLLFVGRLAAVKGLPVLLDAVADLQRMFPTLKLTIAGDGPDRDKLEAKARQLGINANVVFVGYQSQRQVRELLAQTDVFAMASFAEGVPVVLMEAMAAAVPVVATQIAGVPELVENGVSGFLVPPSDAAALAEKIAELLRNQELREAMGRAGKEKVCREFNLLTEADKLCQILTTAVAGPKVAGAPPPQQPKASETDRILGAA